MNIYWYIKVLFYFKIKSQKLILFVAFVLKPSGEMYWLMNFILKKKYNKL